MSDFKIKVEEDTFWKEIKEEKIIGDIFCPICRTMLIVILAVDLPIAYCPSCRKYFELMKKCKRCGAEYSVNEIHFCSGLLANEVSCKK